MTARALRLHPSILSADFARLADELARMRAAAGSRGHAEGAARLVDLVEDAAATGGRA